MKILNKIIGGSSGVIAAALALSASTTQAQSIVNPGFEGVGAVNTGNGWTVNPISLTSGPAGGSGVNQGWATFDNTSTLQTDMSSDLNFSPHSGSYALYETIAAGNNWQTEGGYQVISGIIPGHTYQLSAWAVSDTGAIWVGGIVQMGFLPADLSGNLETVENPYTGPNNGSGVAGVTFLPSTTGWTKVTTPNGTAPAGYTDAVIYGMLQDYNNITYNEAIPTAENIYYDDFTLTDVTPVPEPATLALAGLGGAALLSLIRRRKS
jgi:hypothetical protein